MNIKPLKNKILGRVAFGEHHTESGIVISVDDNAKSTGIRNRWAKVWKVGEDVIDVKPGDWVLVEHGRWSFKVSVKDEDGKNIEFMQLDPAALMLINDSKPADVEDITF